jgi:microsomal dipeptidase-like Zn-dependent dipeptidase
LIPAPSAPRLALWLALVMSIVRPTSAGELPDGSVELHAHLFMEHGLGALYRGGFDQPLVADSWDARLSSKANAEALEASGAAVVVVALFAHPLFSGDLRGSIRAQIDAAERFVKRRRGWAIARSAPAAERLLRSGKRVLVLSLEGAGGVLESEEDLREFIDERGIRIVTPLHLVDDRIGGAALLRGDDVVGNPLSFVDQLLDPHCSGAVPANRRGLAPAGRRLVMELLRRGVWIDLTHASDAALADLVPLVTRAGQPPLVTHTTLRRHQPAERATSDGLLAAIAQGDGIVGLLPSAEAMGDVQPPCPSGCDASACRRGAHAFAALYREVAAVVGADAVMLGADWNGGMRHLPPSCKTTTSLDAPGGLYHMGQERELWTALAQLGAPVPPLRRTVERFLSSWSRVRPLADGARDALPARDEMSGPSLHLRLGAGIGSTTQRDPGVALWLSSLVRKDRGAATEAEASVYFARIDADATLALEPTELSHFELSAAPLGIVAERHDSRALAEGLPVRLRRHLSIDEALALQPSLLRALARTMPGLWKAPGRHALFIELEADAIGSKHVVYDSGVPILHALHFAGGGLLLGGRAFFERQSYALIEGRAFIDANLALPAAYIQSDSEIRGRFALGFVEQGVEAFVQASWLGLLDGAEPGRVLTGMRYLGGVTLRIF